MSKSRNVCALAGAEPGVAKRCVVQDFPKLTRKLGKSLVFALVECAFLRILETEIWYAFDSGIQK